METFIKVSSKEIKRQVIVEETVNIDELENQVLLLKEAIAYDVKSLKDFKKIEQELSKTELSDEIKGQLLSSVVTSGTGVTPRMLKDLEDKIEYFKNL